MQRVTLVTGFLVGLAVLACQHTPPDPVARPGATIQVDSVFSTYKTLATSPYRKQTSVFLTTFGLVFDKADNLYFADLTGNRIGKITPDLRLSSWAGTGLLGDTDNPREQATFFNPTDLTFDPSGRLTIATTYAIRQIQPDGSVKTIVGTGASNSPGLLAGLFNIAYDQAGSLYAVAWGSSGINTAWQERGAKVLRITPDHRVTLLVSENKDASLHNKWFEEPRSLAVDSKGNLYIAGGYYGIVRVTPQGNVTTFVGTAGHPTPDSSIPSSLGKVSGLVVDGADNVLFIASPYLCKATPEGAVTILAGNPDGRHFTGRGDEVYFSDTFGLALNSAGDLFITNWFYDTIYRIRFSR